MLKSLWLTCLRSVISNRRQTRSRIVSRQTSIERLEDRALLATQVISATPLTQAIVPGNTVSIDVDYSTLDDGGQPANLQDTALGLLLHYDSSALTFNNLTNVLPAQIVNQADQLETAAGISDGDPNTDRVVLVSWTDLGGDFPGASLTQPALLYNANFDLAVSFTGTTTINFTRSTQGRFVDFVANSPTITEFITPDISISDAADVTEGGTSIFTVTLDQNPSGVVTVNYATSHDTTDNADYPARSGQLTFNPGGALTQTIGVPTTQDGTVEPDETFFVDLSNATNGNITDNQGQGRILNDDLPTVSVSSAGTINEGSDAVFIVSLDQATLTELSVNVSTMDGTAVSPGDFTAVSGQNLLFTPGGALTQQVIVPTIDDTTPEADETFTLEIDSVAGGTEDAVNGSGTATIAANDPPTVSIADAGNVAEGGIATFIVSLDQAPAVTLTIDYVASAGTATLVDDFEVTAGTLTFTPTGPLTQAITVQTVQDGLVEQDETFVVDLSNPSNVVLGTAQGQATILDDDVPTISVSDAAAVAEGSNSFFTISLDQAPVAPVTITISTSNGSATDPDDYSGGSGDITFNPGDPLSILLAVTTIDDAVLEVDEDFFLDLSNPIGATIGVAQGRGVITSDDVAVVSIADAADVNEGQSASFIVSISELPLTGQNLTVDVVTADGTAVDGSDYAGGTQTLTFTSAGPLTQLVTVATIDDSLVEPDETFVVNLGNVGNGTIGTGQGQATIISDDVPAVSVSNAASVAEGQDAVFTISLDQLPLGDVTIEIATSDGTAVSPDDYSALATQTVTFNSSGPLTQTIAIGTVDDALVEADETFFLDLSNPVGVTLANNQGMGTITSDDVPTVSIANSPDTTEGQGAIFSVSIDQEPLPGQDLTVDVNSSSGTADDGVDYTTYSQTLTFTNGGPLTQDILIATTDDTEVELDETFFVDLSNVAGGTIGTAQGQATILDNDLPTISIDDVSVAEGTDAVFTVSLDQAPIADVTVSLSTTDDTAVSPDDFTADTNIVLTFSPGGPLTQQVTIATIDDALVEPSERFFVDITDLNGATVADGQGQATLTSNDGPSISISDAADVTEGGDSIFTVSLNQAPLQGFDVTVDVMTGNGTADSGSDFTSVSQTLTFTFDGPLTQQVTVSTTDDSTVEVSESFTVNLTNAGNGSIVSGQGSGTILDNDLPTVSIDDVSVTEGQDAIFTVSLDQAPVTSLTFTFSTTDGTATSPDDFTAVTDQTVTFDPGGPLTQQVTITTINDTTLEFDEDFTVDLSNASNVTIGVGQGRATISSDDFPSISIDDAAAVDEGQESVFTVSLDQAPLTGMDLTVDFTTVDGTAQVGTDLDSMSGTLTFTSTGPLTQQIRIQTINDTTVEATEDFTVQIGNATNGTITDSIGDGSILSDDLPAISISDAGTIDEGQDAVFTVSLDQAPVTSVSVTLSTANGTAIAPGDYTAIADLTLTFNPGEALTQDVSVTTINDTDVESDETFLLDLTVATGATISDAQGSATIRANDAVTTAPVVNPLPRISSTARPEITWQSVPGAVSYEVWIARRFPSVARILQSDSMVSTTSFTPPSDLEPGAFYKTWVRPIDGEGVPGPWSNEVSTEIPSTVINPDDRTFNPRPTFEWNPILNAPGYEIFIRTASGDIRVTDIASTSYTPLVDLAAGPIRWWVRSSDAIGNRGWSDLGKKDLRTSVTSPTGSTSNTTPTITWAPVAGAGRYILHVLNLDTNTIAIRKDDITGTSFTAPSALSGNYRVWVKAINGATDRFDSGRWSMSADFTVASVEGDSLMRDDVQLVSLNSFDDQPENADTTEIQARRQRLMSETTNESRPAAADERTTSQSTTASLPDFDFSAELSFIDEWMGTPELVAELIAG